MCSLFFLKGETKTMQEQTCGYLGTPIFGTKVSKEPKFPKMTSQEMMIQSFYNDPEFAKLIETQTHEKNKTLKNIENYFTKKGIKSQLKEM